MVRQRTPWLLEVMGFFGVLVCVMVGVRIAHLPFEKPVQPPRQIKDLPVQIPPRMPEPVPVRGMAIWLGAGAFLGLTAGVCGYWLLLRVLGYDRRSAKSASQVERKTLAQEERLSRARRRQQDEALWQITSPPLSSYQNEHTQQFTGRGSDKSEDDPIAVVIPRQDCTPGELLDIGRHLRRWLETRPYARKVIGLEDLEAGRQPASPGYYLFPLPVQFTLDDLRQRFPHDVWTAALLIVAGGYEVATISKDLEADLAAISDRLVKYGDPVSFDPLFS